MPLVQPFKAIPIQIFINTTKKSDKAETVVPSAPLVLSVHSADLSNCLPVGLIVYSQELRSGVPEEDDKSQVT